MLQLGLNERSAGLVGRRTILRGVVATAAAAAAAPVRAEGGRLKISALANGRAPLQRLIDDFHKANPSTRVSLTVADVDPLQTTTRVQLASGTAPDIITVWPGNGNPLSMEQIAPLGFLDSLSGRSFASRVPKRFDHVLRYKGELAFLPQQLSAIGCVYNRRVWAELKLSEPKTLDQFYTLCDSIKKAGKVPIGLGLATPWITQLMSYALVCGTVYAADLDFDSKMRAKQIDFEKSGWHDALAMYVDFGKRGYFNANPNGTAYEEVMRMIVSGAAGMAVFTSSSMPAIYAMAGHREFGMFALPAVNDPQKVMVPASPGSGFGLNAKSENKEAALAFLDFVASPEETNVYAEVSSLPPALSGGRVLAADSPFKEIVELVTAGRSILYMDANWPNARVQQVHFSGIQQLFDGSAKIDDVLKRMDDAYYAA